jgi:fumarate reductase subunit C
MSTHPIPREAHVEPRAPTPARRPYHRPVSKLWWLERRSYLLFVIREMTSVFVAGYCVFLLYGLYRLGEGPTAYAAWLESLQSPLSIALHLVALVFVLYHTITWFNLTPKIMVVQIGEEQVSPLLVAGGVYAGSIVVTSLVLWLLLRS